MEEHGLPRPTLWPLVMGAGVTLLVASVVTNLVVGAAGLLLLALAVRGWIGDLLGGTADEAAGAHQSERS